MFLLMRALLVIFASSSGYLITLHLVENRNLAYIGLISGLLIAFSAIRFEQRVKKTPLKIVIGGATGLITGLIVANLLTYPLVLNFLNNKYIEIVAYLLTNTVIGYLGLSIGMKKGDEFEGLALSGITAKKEEPPGERAEASLLIDTSVIIDGRVAEVCETGFIQGTITVPQFILQELQYIADSHDPLKRTRGRRGLDILKQLQMSARVKTVISEEDVPDIKEVDAKLVVLAKRLGARVLTNDSNLHKIAEIHGVAVLNINRLATAMKPVVLPGEVLNIMVAKEGKEHSQGVGYLDDGTMVVIDNAREFVGKPIDVTITSVLQTTGGRMIFSKVKEDAKRVGLTLSSA